MISVVQVHSASETRYKVSVIVRRNVKRDTSLQHSTEQCDGRRCHSEVWSDVICLGGCDFSVSHDMSPVRPALTTKMPAGIDVTGHLSVSLPFST